MEASEVAGRPRRGAVVSWSGGKDSALALAKAAASGVRVIGLVNVVTSATARVAFQGVPPGLVALQARALGLPLFVAEYDSTDDPERCRVQSESFLRRLAEEEGADGLVSGYIGKADRQGAQIGGLCRRLGLTLHAPLAGRPTAEVIDEFLASGFKAVVVKVDADRVDARWLGKPIDRRFVAALRRGGADPCGDRGEYHSLVVDGPGFRRPVEFEAAGTRTEGPDRLLDIRAWRLGRRRVR